MHIEPGQKVFEVGTGSAWNAALMSTLVGPEGKVVTMEIIPELAQKAKSLIERHKLKNILMIEGDAGHGYQSEALMIALPLQRPRLKCRTSLLNN